MRHPTRRHSLVVAQHVAPLVFLVLTIVSGCAARRITKDYVFSVTGTVETQDELGLQGADVTLELNGPVYEAVDLVRTRHIFTSDKGWFVFAYISHELAVRYTITVRKEGFEPLTISGAAPPNRNHVIKLKPSQPANGEGADTPVLSHYSPSSHD